MILEFLNGSQIEVKEIFGGPKLIMGMMRDTLRIEVSPSLMPIDNLKAYFKDQTACRTLYAYTDDVDDDGKPIVIKNTIGEGYAIFVSIADEERIVRCQPGLLRPDVIEEVFVVTIAQMTYNEYLSAFGTPPNS